MKSLNWSLPLLLVLASTRAQSPCDPGNHEMLEDARGRRSSNFAITTGKAAICDRELPANWYRVQSPAGSLMPTTCVEPFNCSTRLPIWLQGTYPDVSDGEVTVTACYSSPDDCCRNSSSIQLLNCSSFVLFRLEPTFACDSAYCFGDRVPCQDGFSSVDGFEPGCQLITTTTSIRPGGSNNIAAHPATSVWTSVPLVSLLFWLMASQE